MKISVSAHFTSLVFGHLLKWDGVAAIDTSIKTGNTNLASCGVIKMGFKCRGCFTKFMICACIGIASITLLSINMVSNVYVM